MDAVQISAIRAKAETLGGQPLGDNGDALVELAAEQALAYCGRDDIPAEMEQAVAALAISGLGGDVKSLTRGDTAITYRDADPRAGLNPWRRLRTVSAE